MISNPYPKSSRSHLLQTKVDPQDYFFLKRLSAFQTNLTDAILATLYKKFIDELRNIHAVTPIVPALYPTDDTNALIERVLSGFQGGTTVVGNGPDSQLEHGTTPGSVGGGTGAQDATDGTGGIREEMRTPPEQRPDKKSKSTRKREQQAKG